MIAVLKGDITSSRKSENPEIWLHPLKKLLGGWGKNPQQWELVWGDFFQLEITDPAQALRKALQIKALIRSVDTGTGKKLNPFDVRLSIGIGTKTYSGERISESNGTAFHNSGDVFENLKREKVSLAIKSPWADFDEEMNLYLRLATLSMDSWTISSAELFSIILEHPDLNQEEIGRRLKIKQNSVSGRWSRAHAEEILAVEERYQKKIKTFLKADP